MPSVREYTIKGSSPLILDTDTDIFIAHDTADMARQLLELLDGYPDDETLAWLAATVLGCDTLDVIITHTNSEG